MQFTLNGDRLDIEPSSESLLHYLREQRQLRGTKNGCEQGQCGACRVLVDGVAQPSCRLALADLAGKNILTIEGISAGPKLHPVQRALIAEQAVQCGFCLPGIVVSAAALLAHDPKPSRAAICTALDINLCRCGVHNRVIRAIQRASDQALEPVLEVQDPPILAAATPSRPTLLDTYNRVQDWMTFQVPDQVTLLPGKMELGQGLHSALIQVAAAELDLRPDQLKIAQIDTQHSLNEGYTSGSRSMETTGMALRIAAAAVRTFCENYVLEAFEARANDLEIANGRFRHTSSGNSLSYWDIMNSEGDGLEIPDQVQVRSSHHSLSEETILRPDLHAKVTGQTVFIQDLSLPEMLHGRMMRPPFPGYELLDVPTSVADLPGILHVHQDGQLLGLVAASAEALRKGMAILAQRTRWQPKPIPTAPETLSDHLKQAPSQSYVIQAGTPVEGPLPDPEQQATTASRVQAHYEKPFQLHATLGPSAGAAQFADGRLQIWTYNQGVFPMRAGAASVTGLPESQIRVRRMEGSGCYGHNGADDAAMDAVVLAMAVPGRPVHVQWTRADENAWEPTAPAMAMQFEAGLDAQGQLTHWNQDVWSYPHLGRPGGRSDGFSNYLVANQRADAQPRPPRRVIPAPHLGGWRNAEPLYALPALRNITHFVPDSPLRTSSFRGLGAFGNVFAIESFMDEAARAADQDPLQFRLRYLQDARARAVLIAAAEGSAWADRSQLPAQHGRGLAFARYKNQAIYLAAVVDVEVRSDPFDIRLLKVVIAADAGQIVDADGIANQLEGGFIQAASMALYERVTYDDTDIHSLDWESYPILRFGNSPAIKTILLDRPGQPFLGTGEGATGPAPAAIANAVAHAGGGRLRQIPFLR
jgi:CO/xanthine dehydrogenase Mo-binding subunit/aerobic-type carbon monoxide dehydrogenase small subunit (CoxS/CutS family)